VVQEAAERIVAARPSPSSSQDELPAMVRKLRDVEKLSWMAIGKRLGLPGAKYGAGRARALYASANNGVVPRTHAPRKGTTPKPQTPGSTGTVTSRKQQLVDQGHVIPRDMPDEEVEALVRGRTIEWAIDLAKLTNTDPATWGSGDGRWVKQEARVSPVHEWVYVGEEDKEGNRLVRFREWLGYDQKTHEPMSGPTRTVRVDAIYTIR
jgi:hypothetical protein